jgi:hypothetical protein
MKIFISSTAVLLIALTASPVGAADFNGDGTNDIGIFRPGSGLWAVRSVTRVYFGKTGDEPMPGDYDGDGTVDIALFRPSSGLWAARGVTRVYFGSSSDEPLAGIPSSVTNLWGQNGANIYYTAGNVGIGTSAPVYLLHLKDTTSTWVAGIHNAGYSLNHNGMVVRADAGDPFRVQISAGENVFNIDNDGNVGIGTITPASGYMLDVEGKIQATAFDTGDITFRDPETGIILWRMFEDDDGLYLEKMKTGTVYTIVLEEAGKKGAIEHIDTRLKILEETVINQQASEIAALKEELSQLKENQ